MALHRKKRKENLFLKNNTRIFAQALPPAAPPVQTNHGKASPAPQQRQNSEKAEGLAHHLWIQRGKI